uniref:Uncharacterized protein n=1 Tax=Rhizophora mucronata TaxID=61149 RepID=A0A2P2J4A7_RHIMU
MNLCSRRILFISKIRASILIKR